jgi:hypothetical protein
MNQVNFLDAVKFGELTIEAGKKVPVLTLKFYTKLKP